MTGQVARGLAGLWACAVLLQACSGVGVKPPQPGDEAAYQQRAARIGQFAQWGFSGKLSLDDGESGGSGTLRWNSDPVATELDFRGTLGRGAWQLLITSTGAMLREADGNEASAADVRELVRDRIGWAIPVDDLAWWVRGLQAPGVVEGAEFDAEGRLISLSQAGWTIGFGRYGVFGGEALPVRLEARRGEHRVKLAVGRWRLGPDAAE